jgi:hypothetical protein
VLFYITFVLSISLFFDFYCSALAVLLEREGCAFDRLAWRYSQLQSFAVLPFSLSTPRHTSVQRSMKERKYQGHSYLVDKFLRFSLPGTSRKVYDVIVLTVEEVAAYSAGERREVPLSITKLLEQISLLLVKKLLTVQVACCN